jgi:MOSC domain-containing protein YiiM
METEPSGWVAAVCRSDSHSLRKTPEPAIHLLASHGVEGDAHSGETVQHRSRVARDPSQPNLRQVHFLPEELFDQLRAAGFPVKPGMMGENVTTRSIDLLGLPAGTKLHLGESAVVAVTGLRNPCTQLDGIYPGLMGAVLDRDEHGRLLRKAGVMGVVLIGGIVSPGDGIRVERPEGAPCPLQPV